MDLTTLGIDVKQVIIVDVDEVGCGQIAGLVVAAAVILNPQNPIDGLKDSKQLTAMKREYLDKLIREKAAAFAIGQADVAEIDGINILQASLLAMQRAVALLSIQPSVVLVDGNRCPQWGYRSHAIIRGDALIESISAAAIIAKVYRDGLMKAYHDEFPVYGFDHHMGYATEKHRLALQQYGPCILHRRSFSPVKEMVEY